MELDEDAGIDGAFLVALRQLVAAQRRAAARAVGDDLVPLEEQILVPKLLHDPPERFDILIVEGHIGRLEIDPEGHAFGQRFPLADVLHGRLAAELVELGDAELLDLLLAAEAQSFLDLDLDGQAMGIPAAATLHIVALHGVVAREDVLEGTRQHMVDAGPAIGRRRPFVEDIFRPALAFAHAALEDIALPPQFEDLGFHLREADRGTDVPELRLGCCLSHIRFSTFRNRLINHVG